MELVIKAQGCEFNFSSCISFLTNEKKSKTEEKVRFAGNSNYHYQ